MSTYTRATEADSDGVVKDDVELLLKATSSRWIAWLDDCRRDLRQISTQDGREYQVRQEARRRWVATCLREQTVTRDERGRPVYPDQPHDETEASDQAARLEALAQAWCEFRRAIPTHEHESVSRWIERALAVADRRGARIVGQILARNQINSPEPQKHRGGKQS